MWDLSEFIWSVSYVLLDLKFVCLTLSVCLAYSTIALRCPS